MARRAHAAGAWISLAHPYWNAVSEIDALSVADFIHAVEVYNNASEVGVRRGWGMHQAEVLTSKGHRVGFNAADDAHFKHPLGTFNDAFGGWVQVRAESLCPDALLAALKAGEYYSSTGPELHNIEIDGDVIRIESSPVRDVIVSGRGATFRRSSAEGQTSIELPLPEREKSPYVRVTVVDDNGNIAWTNPIWFDA